MSDPTIIWDAVLTGAHGDIILSNNYQWGSAQFRLTGVDGWFGGVGVWGDQAQRVLNHGLFERKAVRTGRVLTLTGSFYFEDEQERHRAARYLSSLMWDGEQGTLTVNTGGLLLQSQVRLDGQIGITLPDGSKVLKLSVPLIGADPFLYAPPQRFQIYPAGAGTGLVYPLFATKKTADGTPVLDWGKGTPVGGMGVNEGNATAYPTFTVRGDWPGGFTLTANGKRLTYAAPVHNSTPVVVDCKNGSVLAGGMDRSSQLTERAWFIVDPDSTFQPTIRALAQSSGWADVEISSTYI